MLKVVSSIVDHLRVFRSENFREMVEWNLHDLDENWYNTTAAFQIPMLELAKFWEGYAH